MIITRAPTRVSIFGGSTDYLSFFSKHSSLLLGFAINKYIYVTIKPINQSLSNDFIINYSQREVVNSVDKIQNPGIRATLQYFDVNIPLEIHVMGDLPAKTGLGTSSALIVGLINALRKLKGQTVSKNSLIKDSIRIERHLLLESGGIQDNIFSSVGGFNSIDINTKGQWTVRPLPLSENFLQEFKNNSLLLYSGQQRKSHDVAKSHEGPNTEQYKKEIQKIAHEGNEAFYNEDLETIGKLLDKSWLQKRQISPLISNDKIDSIYNRAHECEGTLGLKLLGSGDSGFIFIISTKKEKLIQHLDLPAINYDFDYEGSKVIFSN